RKPWVRRRERNKPKRRKNAALGVSRGCAAGSGTSREAAQECSPRSKPWVRRKGAKEAAKRRKNAAHGVSRGCDTREGKPQRGERFCLIPLPRILFSARKADVRSSSRSSAKILFLSPLRGWWVRTRPPTAYAVGCILTPLRGWVPNSAGH
ncbi:MAG TPA: hypothetical protein VK639_00110, partial [Terriglobales bacterium]|nr:hypothetical protein [Terriglobales bacterium]